MMGKTSLLCLIAVNVLFIVDRPLLVKPRGITCREWLPLFVYMLCEVSSWLGNVEEKSHCVGFTC